MGKCVSKASPWKKKNERFQSNFQWSDASLPEAEEPTQSSSSKQEPADDHTHFRLTCSTDYPSEVVDCGPEPYSSPSRPAPRMAFEEDCPTYSMALRTAALSTGGRPSSPLRKAAIEEAEDEVIFVEPSAENEYTSGIRPLSAVSVNSLHSSLSFSSNLSSKRIKDWHRSTDRNLCHVYRLCEEYLFSGCGQRRPDSAHMRGIDFAFARRHVNPDTGAGATSETADDDMGSFQPFGGPSSKDNAARASQVLSGCDFFKTLETSSPGFIQKLAGLSDFGWEVAGQMLVRQGDPSGNVYVMVSGEVGINIINDANEQKLADRSPRPESFEELLTMTEKQTGEASATSPTSGKRRGSTGGRRQSNARRQSLSGAAAVDEQRYRTSEGFSTFCTKSTIGSQVATKGPGAVFGERGAGMSVKRAATVICLADSELLVIQAEDYKKIMAEVLAKSKFFDKHVPGCKVKIVEGEGKCHSSSFFREGIYKKGHRFLSEGIYSQPVIYVVQRGSVELCRCEEPLDDPAKQYNMGSVGQSKTWSESSRAMMPYDLLSQGDVFCSLGVFSIQALEPLTAMVKTAECKVYFCEGPAYNSLSPAMLETLRAHLMQRLVARLLRVRDRVPEAFMMPLTDAGYEHREVARKKQEREDRIFHAPDCDQKHAPVVKQQQPSFPPMSGKPGTSNRQRRSRSGPASGNAAVCDLPGSVIT